jgi:hypothetical protein
MITVIWDFLFTRKIWTILHKEPIYDNTRHIGFFYVLQDQLGNIKKKSVKVTDG